MAEDKEKDQNPEIESQQELDPEEKLELEQRIVEEIKTIFDPEIPVNIYELGLIYEVQVYGLNNVHIVMTLTSPSCPVAGSLPGEVQMKIASMPEVNEVDVELTFDPPWDQTMMSEEAKLELGFM